MVLDYITDFVKVGTNTNQLDELCHNLVLANGAIPAPLNYHGFPKSICTSINHEVCHGIPSKNKTLKNGDIVNIDVSVNLDSWYGDSSRTYVVGKIGPAAKRLVKVAEETMWEGSGELLVPGMVFTIEPMVNLGKRNVSKLLDGWTVVTSDRSLSAQFEHMIAVTQEGYMILTLGKFSNILA
ncbi:methionine aminopeptidase-like [Triplophysa rosa]|uniref:methionine aminopeptidase-like n=1 Tax=Triplophysa rosa TaxID=992332 RepID=UPI00254615F4|nr:methionine aminopeptidase-like [Triplophysa rosa]